MTDLLDTYPTLHPAYLTVRNDGVVHLRAGPWSGSVFTLRNEPSGAETKLFDLLNGTCSYAEILDRVGPQDAVETVLTRLSRQNILYFLNEPSNYPNHRVPDKRPSAEQLGNKSGEISYFVSTYGAIGDLISDYLRGLDSQFDHIPLAEVDDLEASELSEYDFGIVLTDRFKPTLIEQFNSTALTADLPWVVGQVNGFDAIVGPTVVPGETACYRCYLERIRSNVEDQLFKLYYEGSKQVEAGPGFEPLQHMVESYIGIEISHLEQFGQGFTVERIFTVSGTTMQTSINDVLKLPRCDACADLQNRKRFVGYGDFPGGGER